MVSKRAPMTESQELAQSIGTELEKRLCSSRNDRESSPFSFLYFENTVFYHQYSRSVYEPSSSILRLIQGIYEIAPQKARQILRSRIYSNENPTELCYGAVKVSAKRLTASLDFRTHVDSNLRPVPEDLKWVEVDQKTERPFPPFCETAHSETDFLKLAGDLAETIPQHWPQDAPRYLRDRQIAAILVSEKNEVLSCAINTNALNRTLHAELNLVQEHFYRTGKPIPRGSKIFVTLKPCKMCAGAIWVSSKDPFSTQVFYSEFDPGRNARWTVLDPGSSERQRVEATD